MNILKLFGVEILANEQPNVEMREAASSRAPEPDEEKFRRLTMTTRDLLPMQYNKAVDMSYYLWQRNPLARRMIQILKDYCVGEDFRVTVKIMRNTPNDPEQPHEDTQKKDAQLVWNAFADDPVNEFYYQIAKYVEEKFLFGELHIPVAVNEVNGKVRLGYIDPKLASEFKVDESGMFVDTIAYYFPPGVNVTASFGTFNDFRVSAAGQVQTSEAGSTTSRPVKVIRTNSDVNSKNYGKLDGELFFFRCNNVMNQQRGYPELLQLIDWLDGLDQFLFTTLEGAALRNSFFYWLQMTGWKQDEIDKLQIAAPKPATVKVTNENAKWEVISPDLKSTDTTESTRLFKNFILGGLGFPEHWFADGGNANRATAAEMDTPIMRMLKAKQREVERDVKTIARFVIDQALIHQALTLEKDEFIRVEVSTYDFERSDAAQVSQAFVQTVSAMQVAVDNAWINPENAKKVVDGIITGHYGVEVDPNESVESIKQAQEEDKLKNDVASVYNGKPVPVEQQ